MSVEQEDIIIDRVADLEDADDQLLAEDKPEKASAGGKQCQ